MLCLILSTGEVHPDNKVARLAATDVFSALYNLIFPSKTLTRLIVSSL